MMEEALPHSGTHGSKRARRSPWPIAVRRALHRLLAPRHPPAALGSLIILHCAGARTPRSRSKRFRSKHSRWLRLRSTRQASLGARPARMSPRKKHSQ